METTQTSTKARTPVNVPAASRAAAQPAAGAAFARSRDGAVHTPLRVQTFGRISSPNDPAEREADAIARKIVRMALPEGAVPAIRSDRAGILRRARGSDPRPVTAAGLRFPSIGRFADAGVLIGKGGRMDVVARRDEGEPVAGPELAGAIGSSMAAGTPLPDSVRRFMEPRFGADFSGVRIHGGEKAAVLSRKLGAQAFTVGDHIFFGRDRFRPESSEGRELIAHELTHTIQQGSVIQRRADVHVAQRMPMHLQRFGFGDLPGFFADRANDIPGFRLFTIVLGVNPINMSRVDRSAANILRAAIEILPAGFLIRRALDGYGIFDRAAAWAESQIRSLGMVGSSIRRAFDAFIDSLGLGDLINPGGVWSRAKRIVTDPIDRLISFVGSLGAGILRFIREAVLRPLAGLVSGTRGYDLLKAVLGADPMTGDPYPRNADTLIGGFMKLIGREDVWNDIRRSGAVARAWAWFQGALAGLAAFVRQIPSAFMQALQSLELADLITPVAAFAKVARVFAGFPGRFIAWAGDQVFHLLQIIFEVVAPGAVPYVRRAGGAFQAIIRNPIGFVGNLVRAGIQGLRQFAANFPAHLRGSLIGWLTGTMAGTGIYLPQAFSMREIIRFVLSVLGATWQNLRAKLVRVVGEQAVQAMETGFEIVTTLVTQGPAAAWERIQESLGDLRELVMGQIMGFVQQKVVQKAITMLVSSLNPAGAFIQAVIAIYNTIMFFVERLRQIGQVAMAFLDSMASIAGGAIAAAAGRVEQTMAGLLTLVISFLARIAGLGKVSDAVADIISKLRVPIEKALEKVVEWIVMMARRLFARAFGTPGTAPAPEVAPGTDTRTPEQKGADLDRGMAEAQRLLEDEEKTGEDVRRQLADIRTRYRLVQLDLITDSSTEVEEIDHIRGMVNPTRNGPPARKVRKVRIRLRRPSGFRLATKEQLRANFPDLHKKNVSSRPLLRVTEARRHIVPSQEFLAHLESTLNGLEPKEAKVLLEKKSVTVGGLSNAKIQEAAQALLRAFFNDVENLWVGNSVENSTIKDVRDFPPGWTNADVQAHMRNIRKKYMLK